MRKKKKKSSQIDASMIVNVSRPNAHCSLRIAQARSANASRVGPIIRVDSDHLLCTTLNRAGSISRVGERVAAGRARGRPARIVVVGLVRNVRVFRVGSCCCRIRVCVRRVVDAIVDGTKDCALVRLAVVDSTVWVGMGRGSVEAEVGRARPERALSEVVGAPARKAGLVGGRARSAGILLVKVVSVVAGPAISPDQRDGTHDSSQSAYDADNAESSTDSNFVRQKALGGGAGGGRGENGRCRVGAEGDIAVHGCVGKVMRRRSTDWGGRFGWSDRGDWASVTRRGRRCAA